MKEDKIYRWSENLVDNSIFNGPCIVGIDEAGRGPVLGPMVYGTCLCPVDQNEVLTSSGFADSKVLDEPKREKLFELIKKQGQTFGWGVCILSPQHLSGVMLRRNKYNLNSLSHDTAMSLLKYILEKGIQIAGVYVDTIGDPAKYQKKIKETFPQIEQVVVSKKADSLFPIVSAASIVAKVTRDTCVKEWTFLESRFQDSSNNYGSGYPGDPATVSWLEKNCDPIFGYPSLVRFSWATTTKHLEQRAVKVSWDEDDELLDETGHYFRDINVRSVKEL